SNSLQQARSGTGRESGARLSMRQNDIRIESVSHSYEDFLYRTPIKFGGVAVDRVTQLNVEVQVRTGAGMAAKGFGSMPLGNVWSYPSKTLGYDATLAAMRALAERISRLVADCKETGHPIDLAHALERDYRETAVEVSRMLGLSDPIPWLATLVVASPFDAA